MKPALVLRIVFGASLALVWASPAAWAESAARPCFLEARVLPGPEASLPANAPAMVFLPASLPSMRSIDNYMIELRGPGGELVPYSLIAEGDAYLVRFGVPLSPGPMEIKYVDFCSPIAGTFVSRTVNVEPTAALPTSLGVATVSPQARFFGDLDPCTVPAEALATVELHPSAEITPFLAITRWVVTYGGERRTGYGEFPGQLWSFSVGGSCGGGEDFLTGQVTIAAHIAGSDVDPPPVVAAVMARCPISGISKNPPTCVPGSGAPRNPDAAAGIDGGAGTDEDAGTAVPRGRRSGGGCSIGGEATSSVAALGVLLAVGSACRRRRRTRPRSR